MQIWYVSTQNSRAVQTLTCDTEHAAVRQPAPPHENSCGTPLEIVSLKVNGLHSNGFP